MSNVVTLHPFSLLGKMDQTLDRILVHALHLQHEGLLLNIQRYKDLSKELRAALLDQQREPLEDALRRSIDLVRQQRETVNKNA